MTDPFNSIDEDDNIQHRFLSQFRSDVLNLGNAVDNHLNWKGLKDRC